ncbi:MAG TPA: hypothetical protein PK950_02730 [Candidatus Paceibacterota bacterium]|nr:hypothetical protein [Candidatus Paceibacterota bacterium]
MAKSKFASWEKRDVRAFLPKIREKYMEDVTQNPNGSPRETIFKGVLSFIYANNDGLKNNFSFYRFESIVGSLIDHSRIKIDTEEYIQEKPRRTIPRKNSSNAQLGFSF